MRYPAAAIWEIGVLLPRLFLNVCKFKPPDFDAFGRHSDFRSFGAGNPHAHSLCGLAWQIKEMEFQTRVVCILVPLVQNARQPHVQLIGSNFRAVLVLGVGWSFTLLLLTDPHRADCQQQMCSNTFAALIGPVRFDEKDVERNYGFIN